jgi:hypothetical protein
MTARVKGRMERECWEEKGELGTRTKKVGRRSYDAMAGARSGEGAQERRGMSGLKSRVAPASQPPGLAQTQSRK